MYEPLKSTWLIRPMWEFYNHKCADCGTDFIEFTGIHDTCPKCDLI